MHGSLIDWKVLGIEPKALLLPLKSSTTIAVTPGKSLRRYKPAFLRVICLQCEAFIHGVVCLFQDATGVFFSYSANKRSLHAVDVFWLWNAEKLFWLPLSLRLVVMRYLYLQNFIKYFSFRLRGCLWKVRMGRDLSRSFEASSLFSIPLCLESLSYNLYRCVFLQVLWGSSVHKRCLCFVFIID